VWPAATWAEARHVGSRQKNITRTNRGRGIQHTIVSVQGNQLSDISYQLSASGSGFFRLAVARMDPRRAKAGESVIPSP
jgi:hypothetical protein